MRWNPKSPNYTYIRSDPGMHHHHVYYPINDVYLARGTTLRKISIWITL